MIRNYLRTDHFEMKISRDNQNLRETLESIKTKAALRIKEF